MWYKITIVFSCITNPFFGLFLVTTAYLFFYQQFSLFSLTLKLESRRVSDKCEKKNSVKQDELFSRHLGSRTWLDLTIWKTLEVKQRLPRYNKENSENMSATLDIRVMRKLLISLLLVRSRIVGFIITLVNFTCYFLSRWQKVTFQILCKFKKWIRFRPRKTKTKYFTKMSEFSYFIATEKKSWC